MFEPAGSEILLILLIDKYSFHIKCVFRYPYQSHEGSLENSRIGGEVLRAK